jgi:hypothetical protein
MAAHHHIKSTDVVLLGQGIEGGGEWEVRVLLWAGRVTQVNRGGGQEADSDMVVQPSCHHNTIKVAFFVVLQRVWVNSPQRGAIIGQNAQITKGQPLPESLHVARRDCPPAQEHVDGVYEAHLSVLRFMVQARIDNGGHLDERVSRAEVGLQRLGQGRRLGAWWQGGTGRGHVGQEGREGEWWWWGGGTQQR